MRIISQDGLHDGMIDVPYEQVSFEQRNNEIWCGYSSALGTHCTGKLFAEYSTNGKAKKAMEMLQNVYYESELSKVYNDGTTFLTTHFRFPKDDEVEV